MSRRTDLADAAITTLAREGLRGLTHRAVDRAAGLPEGSTSYYFRTRQALLAAVVERLAEVDAADLSDASGTQDIVELTVQVMEHWLTVGRDRQLARYELALEATRRPELHETLVTAGARIRARVTALLAARDVPEPDERAHDFAAYLDGLLFDQLAGAGAGQMNTDRLRTSITSLLTAVTTPP